MYPKFDEVDQKILEERQAAFLARQEPKQGDFIRFKNGEIRRIAHVWTDENDQAESIQPSTKNHQIGFYLGKGYMSYSGALDSPIPASKFTRTDETMAGRAWFFHHDFSMAHNGVHARVLCPVWECDEVTE